MNRSLSFSHSPDHPLFVLTAFVALVGDIAVDVRCSKVEEMCKTKPKHPDEPC